jgi:hypothetical protein
VTAPVPGETEEPEVSEDTHPLPADAGEWRVYIASLPARDLFRLAQKDKDRTRIARLFAGFRPSSDLLKNPVVLTRFVEEAQKQPKFAEEILTLSPPPAPDPPERPQTPSSSPEEPRSAKSDTTALKAKLDAHRKSLREKDERIAALEFALNDAQRERDTLRAEADAAQAARVSAEAEAERQRHRRERETRRLEQKAADAAAKPSDAKAGGRDTPAPAPLTTSNAALFEDTMRRLLSRGRDAVVAEVCREALLLLDDPAGRNAYGRRAEGVVRSLLAESLASAPSDRFSAEKQRQQSEEQERLALAAFLEAGDVAGAAESWARLVARRLGVGLPMTLKPNDAALLARMAALMERMDQSESVRAAFDRVRGTAPEVTSQLQSLFSSGGKKLAPLLQTLAVGGKPGVGIRPEELIVLPNTSGVTARRIVRAVDHGEAQYIGQVRAGLRALRERGREGDAALAEALAATVTRIDPVAACPLLQKSEPRPIVVDASNVARHDPDPLALKPPPRVAVLRQMRDYLLRRGWFPVVLIADANLRFHVDDKPGYLALVEAGIVQETPPGTVADAVLIREAQELGAPLVTNDRLADWGDAAARLHRYGFGFFPGGVTLTDF